VRRMEPKETKEDAKITWRRAGPERGRMGRTSLSLFSLSFVSFGYWNIDRGRVFSLI
jgi:hypothetical protein